jgi:ADP-heptose:LPS heptosyltransferase
MDLRENVEDRIRDYKAKLELIDQAMAEEMKVVCSERRIPILQLWRYEKKACQQTVLELESLLQGPIKPTGKSELTAFRRESIADKIHTAENGARNKSAGSRTFRILQAGGLGDALLLTPTFRALKKQYPGCKIYVYYRTRPFKEALLHNKYIDRLLYVNPLRLVTYHILWRMNRVDLLYPSYWTLLPSLFYKKHAAEIIGEMLGVKIDDPRLECFLTEDEEREAKKIVAKYPNPVAIHVTAKCTANKNWLTENWEKLVQNNPQYNFLQVGSQKDERIRGAVDLRMRHGLRETFALIKVVRAFVGVDSVFAHVAGAFETPAVVLFGASTPAVWGHATSKNLYNAPSCSPCIDVLNEHPCPHGKLCMSDITVSDVELALSSIITRPVRNPA